MVQPTTRQGGRPLPLAAITAGLLHDTSTPGPNACGAVIVACGRDCGRVGATLIEGPAADLVTHGLDRVVAAAPFRPARREQRRAVLARGTSLVRSQRTGTHHGDAAAGRLAHRRSQRSGEPSRHAGDTQAMGRRSQRGRGESIQHLTRW